MGYVDDILTFHADCLHTNDDIFGDAVVLAPSGNWDNKSVVPCVVIPDHLQGSNEVRGDGVRLERADGRTVRDSILIEFKTSANIQRIQSRQHPDQIKWDGSIWSAVRTVGYDQALKSVLFVKVTDVLRHGENKRG